MATDPRTELAQLEAAFQAAGGRGVDLADRIDALRARIDRADVLAGPWRAIITGRLGFVVTDEQLREWMDDEDTLDEDLAPVEVSVVRRTALPQPAPVDAERAPTNWGVDDVLYDVDLTGLSYDEIPGHWERAQAVAAALNAADEVTVLRAAVPALAALYGAHKDELTADAQAAVHAAVTLRPAGCLMTPNVPDVVRRAVTAPIPPEALDYPTGPTWSLVRAVDAMLAAECDAQVGHDGLEVACRIRERFRAMRLVAALLDPEADPRITDDDVAVSFTVSVPRGWPGGRRRYVESMFANRDALASARNLTTSADGEAHTNQGTPGGS